MTGNWKNLITPIVCLLIGFAVGAAYQNFSWRKCHKEFGRHDMHERHGGDKKMERRLKRFSSKLDLSDEQRGKVKEIFTASRKELRSIRAEVHPRFKATRESTRAEIRKLLTPEQAVKFDEMHAKREKSRKKRRGKRGRMFPPEPSGPTRGDTKPNG